MKSGQNKKNKLICDLLFIADQICNALLVHDGETATDYSEQLNEFDKQYQEMED